VIPCAVCTVHKEVRRVNFLVEPQNQGRRIFRFGPQPVATVWCFGPQNQVGDGLSVVL
jgi:hypothetical protein